MSKRRVTVRRAEPGASDPVQQARQAGIREGREEARAEYARAMAATVARAKADEKALRNEMMQRMQKEIDDLTTRCAVLESRQSNRYSQGSAKQWTSDNTKEWIKPFDEDVQDRPAREPALEPGRDARRRSTLDRS